MQPAVHTIDATNRTLGRVASEAAHALMGKRSPQFVKNQAAPIKVTIEHANKLHIPERRAKGKVYSNYTGYPGGFYQTTMKQLIEKKGVAEVVRKTVDGMIPRNKLRNIRMKNLIITD